MTECVSTLRAPAFLEPKDLVLRAARLNRRLYAVCNQDAIWAPHFWRLVAPSGLPQEHCYLLKDFRTLCVSSLCPVS